MKLNDLVKGLFLQRRGAVILSCLLFLSCSTPSGNNSPGTVPPPVGNNVSKFVIEGEQAVLTWPDDDGYTYIEVYAWGKYTAVAHVPVGAPHLFLKQWRYLTNSVTPEPSASDDWWDLGTTSGKTVRFKPSMNRNDFKAERLGIVRSSPSITNNKMPTPIRRLTISPAGGGSPYRAVVDTKPGAAPSPVAWQAQP
jgi:hypothetical protein